MALQLLAIKGLGLLGKKAAKTISSVKPGKSASHPLIKKLKESTTKVKGYDPKNPVHKEKMNKIRSETSKDIQEMGKKYDRPKFRKGGHVNTSRENRLEELGRVDAEKAWTKKGKRNLKDEKKRIVKELN